MAGKSIKLGESHTLEFGYNAMCDAEEHFQRSLDEVFLELEDEASKFKHKKIIRGLIWAALQENHPDITVKETGKLIQEIGIDVVGEQLIKGLVLAYPDLINEDGTVKKKPN